jgi:hypothetical protein
MRSVLSHDQFINSILLDEGTKVLQDSLQADASGGLGLGSRTYGYRDSSTMAGSFHETARAIVPGIS